MNGHPSRIPAIRPVSGLHNRSPDGAERNPGKYRQKYQIPAIRHSSGLQYYL